MWKESRVPACFEHPCRELDSYRGVCWYRRTFAVPEDFRGLRVLLRFEGVNYRSRIWLNDVELGGNTDPFLPFSFDVTSRLQDDSPNVLVVAVDNSHHQGDVPGMHVGRRGFGGILRDVYLEAIPRLSLSDVEVSPDPTASGGNLRVTLNVETTLPARVPVGLEVGGEAADGEGTVVASLGPVPVSFAAGSSATVTLTTQVEDPSLWSPESPALYSVRLSLRHGENTVDRCQVRFGFRRIEATADGLLLNGSPLFLTGFNRHEDSPNTDGAQDLAVVRRDLERMKDAGANMVRLCHYPHHPAELDLCDELGLLAFCEIPLYFWDDAEDGRRNNARRVETATRQLTRLVNRDRHHPSIVFWSVSNETADDEPEVAESNRVLIRHVRSLDPTRLCVHVSDKWRTHPNFEEDDVICVNGYPSLAVGRSDSHTDADTEAGAHGDRFGGSADRWRRGLSQLRERYPDKPILVTEFGFCSISRTHGHFFGEDTQARVIEEEYAAMSAPYVCGALIWCWADHAWPPGRFEDGYAVSPYGVVTRSRHKKAAYDTARRLFRARRGLQEPAPSPSKNSKHLLMVREHMREIPQVQLPEGYTMRGMRIEDIGVWTDIERDAEEYFTVRDSLFMDQFGDDLPSIGHRCFILRDPRGLGVGTISAWYNRDFRGQDWGRIHWVALRRSHQGRGLGKAMLTHAMNVLAKHHDRAYLDTDTRRVAAVALYRKYGFRVE
jgi:beta-glucuronidase